MLVFICVGIFFLHPPTHPRHGGRCLLCCAHLSILCSSDAQASGECQPLLLTFLLLERDRMRRAATGCESPGSLRIYFALVPCQYFVEYI